MRKENMDSNAQFEAKIPAERILDRYLHSKFFLEKEITNLKKNALKIVEEKKRGS